MKRIALDKFDLALIDLIMKGVGGIEVLASLRQQQPDAEDIVLTAYGSLQTAVEALRHGAHDYLFKPCTTSELRQSIRAALKKRQREQRQQELLTELEGTLAHQLAEIRAAVGPGAGMPDETGPGAKAAASDGRRGGVGRRSSSPRNQSGRPSARSEPH